MPIRIKSLDETAVLHDVILCDVWGVLHNGVSPFPFAVEALKSARKRGQTVVLITNSPRPAGAVISQFETIGVDQDCFDDIVTSGDVTRRLVSDGPRKIFFLGPDRDRLLVDGLDVDLVPADEAEAVLCTGLFDDETETPDAYADMLVGFHDRGLPLICANPDVVVERGDRLVYCAGALANAYQAMGGETRIAGKPHSPIYNEALSRAATLRGRLDQRRIVAIGDGVPTDIRGALANHIPVIFVTRGVHARDYYDDRRIDEARLVSFLAAEDVRPDWWMEWLA
ncbi:TIGR01459 family HAD-type hydrolase [Hoeflea marina]|nr:TIGR01459 family HAD-type hydrolase [Hoeflea marina]